MLGAPGVGKTSLVRRFVSSMFSDRYQSTIGVKIDRKQVDVGDRTVNMLLWDLEGVDQYDDLRPSFLRGSAACVFVVDSTRAPTFDIALRLRGRVTEQLGEHVPMTVVLNKSDLEGDFSIDPARITALVDSGCSLVRTSALTGANVESMFEDLAARMLKR